MENLLYWTVYLMDPSPACFTARDSSPCPAHSNSSPPSPPPSGRNFTTTSRNPKSDKGCLTQGKLPGTHPQTQTAPLQGRGKKKMATWTASDVTRSTLKSGQTSCLLGGKLTWEKWHGLWGFCSQPNQFLILALLIMLICFKSTSVPSLPSFREVFRSCVSCKHLYAMLVWLHGVGRWAGVLFTSSQSSEKSAFPYKSIQSDYVTTRHLCAFWRGSRADVRLNSHLGSTKHPSLTKQALQEYCYELVAPEGTWARHSLLFFSSLVE